MAPQRGPGDVFLVTPTAPKGKCYISPADAILADGGCLAITSEWGGAFEPGTWGDARYDALLEKARAIDVMLSGDWTTQDFSAFLAGLDMKAKSPGAKLSLDLSGVRGVSGLWLLTTIKKNVKDFELLSIAVPCADEAEVMTTLFQFFQMDVREGAVVVCPGATPYKCPDGRPKPTMDAPSPPLAALFRHTGGLDVLRVFCTKQVPALHNDKLARQHTSEDGVITYECRPRNGGR